RNADVTLRLIFSRVRMPGLGSAVIRNVIRSNLCTDLITHNEHIMGGKPGKRYIL
ncbi:hypothetical protein GBF38_010696, partial [Nibea albiflora]